MILFTREEKKNKKLMELYDKYIKEGKKPNKAVRMAKKDFDKAEVIHR